MDEYIFNNPIVIFTSNSNCKYCENAKEFLNNKGVCYFEYVLTFDNNDYDELVKLSGQSTVPNIYIYGEHIGGYDKLVEFYNNGYITEDLPFSDIF